MRQCATCLRPMGITETCGKCGWIDPAMEGERVKRLAKERGEAARALSSRAVVRRSGSLYEDEYHSFRVGLLVAARGHTPAQTAAIYVEQLAAWLDDRNHAAWARDTVLKPCGHHLEPHSLLQCLSDELQFWMTQSVSKQIQTHEIGVGTTIGGPPGHTPIPQADLFTGSQGARKEG